MSDIGVTKENIEEADRQHAKWRFFLNNGVGILAFTLALASLGTESPEVNAGLSLFFVILVLWTGMYKFPNLIKELRKKKDPTQDEERVLKDLEKKYFGLRVILLNHLTYLVGMIFLSFVIFWEPFSHIFPGIKDYVLGT